MSRLVLAVCLLLAPLRAVAQEARAPIDAVTTAVMVPLPADHSQDPAPHPPAAPGRFDRYLSATVLSPAIYAQAAAQSGLDRATGTNDWTGVDGFAQRAAAQLGRTLTTTSIHHAVAAVLGHTVAYERCACDGGWSRAGRALAGVAVTSDADGRRVPNVALWSARFGGSAIANAWFPNDYTRADAARSAAIGLAATAGVNLVREFAPELKRLFR